MTAAKHLALPHGTLQFPAFLPDGTQAVVRAVDAADLERAGVQALVMNTFHLMQRPGSSVVEALGGLHTMSGWSGPIMTDSGGFQAYSLMRQNPKAGRLTDKGLTVRQAGKERKYTLTPEKAIQLQFAYGADILVCLDDCTHVDDDRAVQETAVGRTVAWAARCRAEFDKLVEQKRLAENQKPKLFAVVQGGGYQDLRSACADQLLAMGFDGYGYGGWPLDDSGSLLEDMLGYLREAIPEEFPLHALGVGHPENVLACARLGYAMFDSALPTRDARRGRLYAFTSDAGLGGDWFRFVYIQDKEHIRAAAPLSPYCDCPTCTRYSRGYLHHLFKLNDHLFYRLATLHNLRFMRQLEERIGNELS